MKTVFVSGYLSHHQKPFCDAVFAQTNGSFSYIACRAMPEFRARLGYRDISAPYLLSAIGEDAPKCRALLKEADVVIAGSVPEELLRERIRSGRLTLRNSERPLKRGMEPGKYLPRLLKWHWLNPPGKPVYMLCASAFTAWDYHRFDLFHDKCYKWGYFPPTKLEDPETLLSEKDPCKVLWCGRFLDWKHPEAALHTAKRLMNEGISFSLDMIGSGPLEEPIRQQASAYGLDSRVRFLGNMAPEAVREQMDKAGVFIFTSDRMEGWGAVLNEAMNSGCAVVASHAIGSVPFLLRHGENGLVYRSGDEETLAEHVKSLLCDLPRQKRIGRAACETILGEWNAETAAERLLVLEELLLSGKKHPAPFETGPCSPAEIIKDDWFKL